MIRGGSNPLLDHAWGCSSGADRVLAKIAGRAPSAKPWERWFVVLQAYIDESGTEDGALVLGGYVAEAEVWARFSQEWEELLPLATLDKHGVRRLKMSEMAAQNRISAVVPFYRVIESHVALAISCKINLSELKSAIDRVWVPDVYLDVAECGNPQFMGYRALLDMFHSQRVDHERAESLARILPLDQGVDFIFDEHTSKMHLLAAWDTYTRTRPPETKTMYGSTPMFEKEEKFPPLQAADLWAWWVRRAYETDTVPKLMKGDFGYWKEIKSIPKMDMSVGEDNLVAFLIQLARQQLPLEYPIYDAKYRPRPPEGAVPANRPLWRGILNWFLGR